MPERRRQDLNATACGGDGPLGRRGDGVRLDLHGPPDLTPAEHLDHALLVHQAPGPEGIGCDLVALHRVEGVEVDHRVLDPERVLETLQLRDPQAERRLAALEAGRHAAPGALALHAPARGLATLASDATAHPPARTGRPGRRLQVVHLHRSTSSTRIRCGTRAIMPRAPG